MTDISGRFYDRWYNIFLEKMKTQGAAETDAWAQRTFPSNVIEQLSKVIQEKKGKK